jgi:hypothetical protein
VAVRVSPEHVEVIAATTKRAQRYLRWYPSAWRERYGEEFVAHLELELVERPFSLARSSDIVAHGVLARISFQRGLRMTLWATTAVVLAVTVAVGVVALTRYWVPVTITSGYGGGQSGVGVFVRPTQVADMSFNFSTHTRAEIRITSVTVLPLRGFPAPQIVGVDFAPHASDLVNGRGWPLRLPKASNELEGGVPLIPAIGASVNLAPTDALWLGLRAPSLHHAYAAEGLRVTYVRRGISHTMTISQSSTPDVICASSSNSVEIPRWCSQEIEAANTVAAFSNHSRTSTQWPTAEAQMVSQLALNEVGANQGAPTLRDVRRWAARLFTATSIDAIRAVTGVVNAGQPEWRFVIRTARGHATEVLCMTRGHVSAGGGVIGAGAANCP